MVSQAESILRVITLWFLVLSQFFRDGMGPLKQFRTCFVGIQEDLEKLLQKELTLIKAKVNVTEGKDSGNGSNQGIVCFKDYYDKRLY